MAKWLDISKLKAGLIHKDIHVYNKMFLFVVLSHEEVAIDFGILEKEWKKKNIINIIHLHEFFKKYIYRGNAVRSKPVLSKNCRLFSMSASILSSFAISMNRI
jgi:hypothetical protein